MKTFSVLFVCLGNICRSPLAEGVFKQLVLKKGLTDYFIVESCGTGTWHTGGPAHSESQRIAEKYGISLACHEARQVCIEDFDRFDLLVAMDQSNYQDLLDLQQKGKEKIICLRKFDTNPSSLDVPDPYYGGQNRFQEVYDIIAHCCENLMEHLVKKREFS